MVSDSISRGSRRAFAAGARAFLLCNPHNPLGLVHSAAELRAVAELADRYDVAVVSDEIHAPLTHSDATFTPYLTVSEAARRHGIAAHSASKAWNLAGLKCALIVTAHDAMAARTATLPKEVEVRTSLFGRIATAAALSIRRRVARRHAVLGRGESSPARRSSSGTACPTSYSASRMQVFSPGSTSGSSGGATTRVRAPSAAKVALVPGTEFGTQGRGFVRLNFACSPEVLTEAIERLATAARTA